MPTSSEQCEADTLILLLAKGVIDYLNVKALRHLPGGGRHQGGEHQLPRRLGSLHRR
ncbi:hypothetical protein [Streptomyces sp. NPDC058486]|uniref:hypothetical protein n=1 Tax=unclassified Streptomyces TaxID=2593676 RepID=UPI00365CF653